MVVDIFEDCEPPSKKLVICLIPLSVLDTTKQTRLYQILIESFETN